MALQKNPDSIIYLMREDGKVVMLTLEQDQSVQAWSLLEDLGATVESIQTIPSFDGNYDEVYFLMLRQGLATALTYTCSNANLTISNDYNVAKSEIGVVEDTLECAVNRYNVSTVGSAQLSSTGILSGFASGTSYAFCSNSDGTNYYFKPTTKNWEMVIAFKSPDTYSTTQSLISTTTKYNGAVELQITTDKKFYWNLSSDGSTDFSVQTGTHTIQANTDYLVRINFNGSRYTLEYSTDDGATWNTDITENSTKKVYNNETRILGINYVRSGYASPFLGTIDLNKSYIKIDNVYTWQGAKTYWQNNGEAINPSDYGITISGVPQLGDTINLTYTTSTENPVRYIERIKSPITSENKNEWWYLRAALEYNAYSLTEGNNLTLSASTGDITITASENVFASGDVDKYIRALDSKGNTIGEGVITEYTDAKNVNLTVTTKFENLVIQGGFWGISITSMSGLNHLENKTVQVFADGLEQEEKLVSSGSITLDKPSFRVVVGLPYQSYITTMPMEAGSQNGTAVGKRKRISEMAIRVWNSLGVKVGRDLNNLYDTIYQQTEPYTGVIPNIKYNQGWVWDANITVEQSHPYPMNILSIAPIVTEVDK
jgi:hypothetical protein